MENIDDKFKKIVEEFVTESKTNKLLLQNLKSLCVSSEKFHMASLLREFEKEHYKLSKNDQEELDKSFEFMNFLRFFGLNVKESEAFIFLKAATLYIKKGTDASLKESSSIQAQAKKLFK